MVGLGFTGFEGWDPLSIAGAVGLGGGGLGTIGLSGFAGWAGGLDTPSIGQGDPLSPLLFVIIMDAFSKMLDKAVREGLMSSVRVGFTGYSFHMTHLLCARVQARLLPDEIFWSSIGCKCQR